MAATIVVGALLALAALVGLLDAGYFVGVAYGLMRPDASWVPRACRMDEETCASIVDTAYGRVFGLPNAVYGAAWYAVVLALAGTLLAGGAMPSCRLALLAAAGAVLFSVYLIWALVQRLGVRCPLCYLGHGLNLTILVLLAVGCAV